jgi:hypothetical protein
VIEKEPILLKKDIVDETLRDRKKVETKEGQNSG